MMIFELYHPDELPFDDLTNAEVARMLGADPNPGSSLLVGPDQM